MEGRDKNLDDPIIVINVVRAKLNLAWEVFTEHPLATRGGGMENMKSIAVKLSSSVN